MSVGFVIRSCGDKVAGFSLWEPLKQETTPASPQEGNLEVFATQKKAKNHFLRSKTLKFPSCGGVPEGRGGFITYFLEVPNFALDLIADFHDNSSCRNFSGKEQQCH